MDQVSSMSAAKFEKALKVACGEDTFYVVRTVALLAVGTSWEDLLVSIPVHATGMWKQIATIHQAIVVHDSLNACVWLDLVEANFRTKGSDVSPDFWQGAFLGLLNGGLWIDQYVAGTEYQNNVLMMLARVVSGTQHSQDANHLSSNFKKELYASVKKFITMPGLEGPENVTKERLLSRRVCAQSAMRYIVNNSIKGSPDPLKSLFMEYLSQSVFSTLSPLERCRILSPLV